MNRYYNFKSVTLVRIGADAGRIVELTRASLRYADGQSIAGIDLEECARMYRNLQSSGAFPPGDETDWAALADANPGFTGLDASHGCVGLRGAIDEPPWFQFLDRRRTQFEFADYEAIQSELLRPLARVGWSTWDAC